MIDGVQVIGGPLDGNYVPDYGWAMRAPWPLDPPNYLYLNPDDVPSEPIFPREALYRKHRFRFLNSPFTTEAYVLDGVDASDPHILAKVGA
jgi:hypothetical protein